MWPCSASPALEHTESQRPKTWRWRFRPTSSNEMPGLGFHIMAVGRLKVAELVRKIVIWVPIYRSLYSNSTIYTSKLVTMTCIKLYKAMLGCRSCRETWKSSIFNRFLYGPWFSGAQWILEVDTKSLGDARRRWSLEASQSSSNQPQTLPNPRILANIFKNPVLPCFQTQNVGCFWPKKIRRI